MVASVGEGDGPAEYPNSTCGISESEKKIADSIFCMTFVLSVASSGLETSSDTSVGGFVEKAR